MDKALLLMADLSLHIVHNCPNMPGQHPYQQKPLSCRRGNLIIVLEFTKHKWTKPDFSTCLEAIW